ncbi:MAG: hemY [Paucimonas sp.]|jgi:HemY protein|nr:hemY [Paucimonas sp.]
MRIFLRLLILFAAAVGLAVTARYNLGNVVFFYPPHRIDLSLNLFLLLAAIGFVALYFLISAVSAAFQMPGRVAAYRRDKRERESNRALHDALKSWFEGRFGHAEKAARRALGHEENKGLAALVAARAAHRMQESARRDSWLATIEHDKSMKTARLMTAIELLVDEHRPEPALAYVRELNASGTRHIHALRLALKANQRAKNWPEVLRLVRALDKHKALHPALSKRLRELAYEDLLSNPSHDAESIRRAWSTIPESDRVQPYVAVRAADAMSRCGLHDDARALVERALNENWDDRLLRAYRMSAGEEGSATLLAQIERCEAWLMQHPDDAELALTLGVLCVRQKLWGKAQRYLEQALSNASEASTLREAHLKLAQLHEALGNAIEAASHFRLCALSTLV